MCYPGHEGSAEACQNGIGEEVWGAGSQPKVVDTLFRSMGSGHANGNDQWGRAMLTI
ncbi:MAG: hypothetical protein GY808_09450 [Gammaproteobacteria bacterium]|nr:hypothetical protein [Gammaproteobacteria bacterium]